MKKRNFIVTPESLEKSERLSQEIFWVFVPIAALMVLLALTLSLTDQAWSATYNLYFNNAEQGDHSQSKPQINVNPKKGVKSQELDREIEEEEEDAEPVEKQKSVRKEELEEEPTEKAPPEKRISPDENFAGWNRVHARMIGSIFGASMHSSAESFDNFDDLWIRPEKPKGGYESSPVGFGFEFGLFFNQYVGVNLFTNGLFYGLAGIEGELNPFGISSSNLTLGLMFGWTESGVFLQGPSSSHAGARLSYALSKHLDLSLAIRNYLPLSPDSRLQYFEAQGGLSVRL